MIDDIAPGSRIQVKIVKTPTSAAAAKTLVRLLSKDDRVYEEKKRLDRVRVSGFRTIRRGGRLWPIHLVKRQPVRPVAGEIGTIRATVDVLPDLKSVSRFIDVSKA